MVRMSGIGAIERTPMMRESASTSSTVLHSASYVKLEGEYPRVLNVMSRRLHTACKSATRFGWSRSGPKLNSPTRVMKPFFPRGLLRSTSAASRPLRRYEGVTGSIVSTHDNSFVIWSDVLCSMIDVRRSSPSGVALTNSSPRPPPLTMGHDCAEKRCSGR